MNQHSATRLDTALNEPIAIWEMLEEVLIFNIIHLNGLVRETIEETFLHRKLEHGKHVGDA